MESEDFRRKINGLYSSLCGVFLNYEELEEMEKNKQLNKKQQKLFKSIQPYFKMSEQDLKTIMEKINKNIK